MSDWSRYEEWMRQNPVGNLDSGKLLDRPTAHDVVGLSCEPYVLDFDDRGRLFHTARLPHNGESVSMSEKIEESIRPPPTVQTRILLVYLRDGLANHRWPDRLTSLLGAIARICKLEASFLCSLMIEESPDFVGLQGHVSENNSHLNLSFLDAAGTTDGAFSTAYLQRLGYSDSPSYLPDTLSVASSLVSSFISALHSQHVGPRVSVKGINIPENSANQQLVLLFLSPPRVRYVLLRELVTPWLGHAHSVPLDSRYLLGLKRAVQPTSSSTCAREIVDINCRHEEYLWNYIQSLAARVDVGLPITAQELFSPIWDIFVEYFGLLLHEWSEDFRSWKKHSSPGSKIQNSAHDDDVMYDRWLYGREQIEIVQSMMERKNLFFSTPNDTTKNAQDQHLEVLLRQAKGLETQVRETMQIYAQNLSVKESRRSITQADSIGRVSFLAFVFLPISLVTSFFGMNIQEMTGTGVSWRVFFTGILSLSAITAASCAWLWRKWLMAIARQFAESRGPPISE
ncbi:hypothetical protein MMC09_005960 [Bachmanniomyces sp. S44760]|nr:hypothetical protein [Bachmanniomyces sp. S44760]